MKRRRKTDEFAAQSPEVTQEFFTDLKGAADTERIARSDAPDPAAGDPAAIRARIGQLELERDQAGSRAPAWDSSDKAAELRALRAQHASLQVAECENFLSIRAFAAPKDYPVVIQRAVAILLAAPGASSFERMFGIREGQGKKTRRRKPRAEIEAVPLPAIEPPARKRKAISAKAEGDES